MLTPVLQHSNFLYPKEVKGIGKIYYLYSTICRQNEMQFRHARIATVLKIIVSYIQYFSKLNIQHCQELLFVPDLFTVFHLCFYSILDSFHFTFLFILCVFLLRHTNKHSKQGGTIYLCHTFMCTIHSTIILRIILDRYGNI